MMPSMRFVHHLCNGGGVVASDSENVMMLMTFTLADKQLQLQGQDRSILKSSRNSVTDALLSTIT